MNPLQSTLINILNDFVNNTFCPICNNKLYISQLESTFTYFKKHTQCSPCNISAFKYDGIKQLNSSVYIHNYKFYPYKSDYYYLLHQDSLDISNLKINSIHDIISIINKLGTFK